MADGHQLPEGFEPATGSLDLAKGAIPRYIEEHRRALSCEEENNYRGAHLQLFSCGDGVREAQVIGRSRERKLIRFTIDRLPGQVFVLPKEVFDY